MLRFKMMQLLLAFVLLAVFRLETAFISAAEDDDGFGSRKMLRAPEDNAVGKQQPVCIIGAGASGLSFALRLRQKGYKDIFIFERNALPGGKAVTVYVEPNNAVPLYLGAVLGVNSTYPNIGQLLRTYQVPTQPSSADNYLTSSRGLIVPANALPTNQSAVIAAVAKYSTLYDQLKQYLVPGYTKGLTPELQQSYGSWVRANGLEALLPTLYLLVTAYGYGSMEAIPTAYAMSAASPGNIKASLGITRDLYATDLALLWQRVSDDLASSGVKLIYSANISQVEMREEMGSTASGGGSISYKASKNSDVQQQACSRIIAAFPPSKEDIAAFDLDRKQRAVLDKVALVQYLSGIINIPRATPGLFVRMLKDPTSPGDKVTLLEPPGDGLPVMISRNLFSPVGQFWSWIKGGTSIPDDTLKQRTVESVSLFNRPASSPANESVGLALADLRRLDRWTYFPHFGVSAISADLFKELEALQGWRNIYWTSSLRSFESQEKVVESAYDIVDRYF